MSDKNRENKPPGFGLKGHRKILLALVVAFAGAATAIACGWSTLTDHSVRFNMLKGRAFYRLPPLPIMYDAKTGKEVSVFEEENYMYPEQTPDVDDDLENPPVPPEEKAWETVRLAVHDKHLSKIEGLAEEYLKLTAVPSFDEEPYRQFRRNVAYDILDVVTALKQGSGNDAVSEYLEARLAFDDGDSQEEMPPKAAGVSDRNLNDNWAYLQAAHLYRIDEDQAALEGFRKHAAEFPRSEKHEAVLYMIAKITMRSSYSFEKKNCGIMGEQALGDNEVDASEVEPVGNCRDENWHAAIDGFERLIRQYPHGRYVNDSRGWLAYLYRRGGELERSLAEYYRLLGHPSDRAARLEAKKSLQLLGHDYDDETLDEVERLIAGDANAALAYAYHRIYNHAIDLTYEESWEGYGQEYSAEKTEEDKRVAAEHRAGNHELERVAKFATEMMQRHPGAAVGGSFVLRVAEAQLELKDYSQALKLADKALGLGVRDAIRMEALWVKGSSEHKLNQLKQARVSFEKLIAEFPKDKLTEGARRLLAMTAEDQDDLETALDIYMDLDYETDVAYFVDVLFPTDRLAHFIYERKKIPQHNKLLYALGVRYMRDKRWAEARSALRQVRTEKGTDAYLEADKDATWHFAKEPVYDEDRSFIKASWVMQDLKTIDILEHYEQAVSKAEGDENTAEAMYQLASSLYELDDLAFYNLAFWYGGRSTSLSGLQFSDQVRLSNESRIIFEHLQEHDPLARAIPIYEEIVARYPKTKTARDALYSVAVAHERLSGRHTAWAALYERGLFAGPRVVTYADVKSAYPGYQMPRGTYGWKPSTRTVNGGAGWTPAPKPPPKLTREQKIRDVVGRLYKEFGPSIGKTVETKVGGAGKSISSTIQSIYSAVMWMIALLLGGYVSLLWVHFCRPEWLQPPAEAAGYFATATPPAQLPGNESRMENVIRNG